MACLNQRAAFAAVLLAFLPLTSCSSDDSDDDPNTAGTGGSPASGGTTNTAPTTIQLLGVSLQSEAVGEDAVPVAEALWKQLNDENYQSWPLYPGTTEKQAGASPHGAFVTIRYKGGEPAAPADGLIVVKENYGADGTTLGAVTVMLKATDFDSANSDWFYAKYLADGSLDQTPTGLALAGAVEPAPGMACRGCHRKADGEDFLFLAASP